MGCRWDLPLSVIEKCDLENVCPAEHESYLHGDGGELRGGSPDPRQEEPVIGRVLTESTMPIEPLYPLTACRTMHFLIVLCDLRLMTQKKKKQQIVIQSPCKYAVQRLTTKDTSWNFRHLQFKVHCYVKGWVRAMCLPVCFSVPVPPFNI